MKDTNTVINKVLILLKYKIIMKINNINSY